MLFGGNGLEPAAPTVWRNLFHCNDLANPLSRTQVNTGGNYLKGLYFPPEKRATALALYACGIYTGVGLGFWLGGWLNDAFGWRVAFMVIGLPGVAIAILVRLTVREPPRGMSEHHLVNDRTYSLGETWRFLTRLPSGRRISLAASFQAFVGYGLGAWIPAFFIRLHGMTTGELGLWLSWIIGIGGALVQLQGTSLGIAIPSPLWGEGEGEGNRMRFQPPSPPSSPASGRGGKTDSQRGRLFLH